MTDSRTGERKREGKASNSGQSIHTIIPKKIPRVWLGEQKSPYGGESIDLQLRFERYVSFPEGGLFQGHCVEFNIAIPEAEDPSGRLKDGGMCRLLRLIGPRTTDPAIAPIRGSAHDIIRAEKKLMDHIEQDAKFIASLRTKTWTYVTEMIDRSAPMVLSEISLSGNGLKILGLPEGDWYIDQGRQLLGYQNDAIPKA